MVATAGTRAVVLNDLSAVGVENDAVRTFSPDTRIVGGQIVGATCGVTAGAATTISRVSMSLVNDGIRARSDGLVRAEGVDIDAVAVGIDAAIDSPVVVADSRVRAFEAVRGEFTEQGTNELSLPPLNLLGAIGVPLILLALVLELVHVARQRRTVGRRRRWTPPAVSAEAIRRSVTKAPDEPPSRPSARAVPSPSFGNGQPGGPGQRAALQGVGGPRERRVGEVARVPADRAGSRDPPRRAGTPGRAAGGRRRRGRRRGGRPRGNTGSRSTNTAPPIGSLGRCRLRHRHARAPGCPAGSSLRNRPSR